MIRRYLRPFRSTHLAFGLMLGLLAVPCVLTWRAWQQDKVNQMLIAAVESNDTAAVRDRLHEGADPNTPVYETDACATWRRIWDALRPEPSSSRKHMPILLKAVYWMPPEDPQAVAAQSQALLAAGQPGKRLPLVEPRVVDNADSVKALVDAGANVNVRSGGGKNATPLIAAAYFGKAATMKVLLAHHAEVNAVDAYGWNALLSIAGNANPEVIEALLQQGADSRRRDNQDRTVLLIVLDPMQSASTANVRATVASLLRHGIWVHPARAEVQETIRMAYHFHDHQLIQMLQHAAKK